MDKLYQTKQIADFALNSKWEQLPVETVDQLKRHVLDTVGSMIFSIPQPSVKKLFRKINKIGEKGSCQVPVLGGVSPDRATQLYTALVRYLDFMDNFIGKEATCHPSDNFGGLLAAAQLTDLSGKDFLLALATAYEIECRLVEELPVMKNGFDHTLLLAISITAVLSKILGLSVEQTAHAIAMAGCSYNPLVSSRASYTYEFKGFASSFITMGCMNLVYFAREGVTGPIALFEGPKGFDEIHSIKLKYDWSKDNFDLIPKCMLKEYNAEVHTQPAIEAAIELKDANDIDVSDIDQVDIKTFLTSYHITGGGAYGDRYKVFSKEQADHSMPYLIAVALLDGNVYPEQFLPERIKRDDVQQLLKKVKIHTGTPIHKPVEIAGIIDPYTEAYPEKLKAKVTIKLSSGKDFSIKKDDYKGFYTRPFTWEDTEKKFQKLTDNIISNDQQQQIIETVHRLDKLNTSKLWKLINAVEAPVMA
jgi:2-methylcitrate dehydratase